MAKNNKSGNKLPKIPIFGEDYLIELTDDVKKLGEGHAGLCNSDDKIIYIESKQKRADLIRTLTHEFFHGISEETGIRQVLNWTQEQLLAEIISKFVYKYFTPKKILMDILFPKKS